MSHDPCARARVVARLRHPRSVDCCIDCSLSCQDAQASGTSLRSVAESQMARKRRTLIIRPNSCSGTGHTSRATASSLGIWAEENCGGVPRP